MMKDSSFNLIWRVQEKVERSQDKPDLAEHFGTVGICPYLQWQLDNYEPNKHLVILLYQ